MHWPLKAVNVLPHVVLIAFSRTSARQALMHGIDRSEMFAQRLAADRFHEALSSLSINVVVCAALTLYWASEILPRSSTTNVDRMTP
jgi:hypothetical protein